MKDSYARVNLVRLCRLFGLSRQAYYQHFWQQEAISIEQGLVLEQVSAIRKDHRVMGGRKLYEKLHSFLLDHQIKMGRDAFFTLLAEHKLLVKRRRRGCITTFSNHWLRKWPNLIRGMQVNRINQVWVSDITYWKIGEGYMYISLITDVYSHKIVGYHIAQTLASIETLQALNMAIAHLPAPMKGNLIHHSDRGAQYCSDNYVKLLQKNEIEISMTENGDPLENAVAERINGILKSEYLRHYKPETIRKAKEKLQLAVELYNQERPHLSIGLLTPETVHSKELVVEKLWKNYYIKKPNIVNPIQDNKIPVKV